MNSQISQSSISSVEQDKCRCGLPLATRTSKTPQNRGRRFRGCSRYDSPKSCNFFEWIDPPTISTGTELIPQLVKKVQLCEDKITECKVQKVEIEQEVMKLKLTVERLEAEMKKANEEILQLQMVVKKKSEVVWGPCGVVKKACIGLIIDRKSTRLNSSHSGESRMPSSA